MRRQRVVSIVLALLVSGCQGIPWQQTREPSWTGGPRLGLRLKVLPPDELPMDLVADRKQALQVVGVHPGLPAERAGVLTGDWLLWLDGRPVSGMRDSVAAMQHKNWGDTVELTVLRADTLRTLRVTLSEAGRPEDAQETTEDPDEWSAE